MFQTYKKAVTFCLALCVFVVLSWAGGAAIAQSLYPEEDVGGLDDSVGMDMSALPSEDGIDVRSPGMQLFDDVFEEDNGGTELGGIFSPEEEEPVLNQDEIQQNIREQAFNAAITGLMPMTPSEIRLLLETYDKSQAAVEKPIYPYPKPLIAVESISLDPGSAPSVIKVAMGHVTTLSVLDMTGAPWPIQDMTWAGNFEIVQPESGESLVRITPMSEFAYGNLSMTLLGLKTPVIFTINTHRDVVQYRFDARIPEMGPFAEPPLIQGKIDIAAGNPDLSLILDGTPPKEALKLKVGGVDGRTTAYRLSDTTYVRTPHTLLSPGWTSSVSSADGMNVYELNNSPVLLLSDRGTMVRARIREEGDSDE
jgi:intracellular multiplication protein IcmK